MNTTVKHDAGGGGPGARRAPGKAGTAAKETGCTMSLRLTSPAFAAGQSIPIDHTCEGSDVSPPLHWSGAPPGTKSFALICDDPDAPGCTWVHWLLYNIPGTTGKLREHMPASETLPDGAQQGISDFGRCGYGGPCPPPGRPHRYFFNLYALDTLIALRPRASKAAVEKAMQGHILGETSLLGYYQRHR